MFKNGPPELLESLAEYRRLKAEGKWKFRIEFRYPCPKKRKQITYKGERESIDQGCLQISERGSSAV